MAHLPSHPDTDDGDAGHGQGPTTSRTPRWVSLLGVILAIVVVMVLVGMHLAGVLGPGGH